MRPTADQVIQEFDELSGEDQAQVYIKIVERKGNISLLGTNDPEAALKLAEQILGVPLIVSDKNSDAQRKYKYTGSQKVLWKGILIDFITNKYIQSYEELWRLESVLGADVVRGSLLKYRVLDANFVKRLFTKSTYSFYVNQPETYLFSDYGELSESKGGPLKQLTAFESLQRYGLTVLEESKEKQYVRL